MDGIHLDRRACRVDHECRRCRNLQSLKGPGGSCLAEANEMTEGKLPGPWGCGPEVAADGRTGPLDLSRGLRGLQPRCGAHDCTDRGGGDHEQAHRQLPLPHLLEEPIETADEYLLGPLPGSLALVGQGRTEPGHADQGQAEGHEGLAKRMVESEHSQVVRPHAANPVLVDRGRTEPCGDDQGQAEGCEGSAEGKAMSAPSQVRELSTGRYHILMQCKGLPEGPDPEFCDGSRVTPQASGTEGANNMSSVQMQTAFSPGVHLAQLRGGGEGPTDVHIRQRGAGVWSSTPSAERADLDPVREECFPVSIATWNLAGAGKKKIKGIVTTAFVHDLVAVQEYPKQDAGWHVVDHGRMSAVLYQDLVMYRAVGIMYDKSKFRVRKRKRSARGVWVLLEHLASGRELWVGSLHLPVNEVVEEVDRFTAEFMEALPATDKPALLLGDMNTHFTWRVQGEVAEPCSMHSRWSKLRQATVERGLVQIAPGGGDAQAPTFVPRRAGASSTQIDGVFAARCHVTPVQVERDSRHEVGTDHERVRAWLLLRGPRRGLVGAKHRAGGPRSVCSVPPPQTSIDESALQRLAAVHTKPASLGPKFRMSTHARDLQRSARALKTAGAWKTYLSSLRREKDAWKTRRVEEAATNWGGYKQLCRKPKSWMEGYMVASQSETPEQDVVKHFADVFHDAERPDTIQALHDMVGEIAVRDIHPFSSEEIRESFLTGRTCKAVGPDGVPLEMLQIMMNDESTLESFVSYFNAILASGQTPRDWNKSVAALLPKNPQPVQPKELRPIALASHTSKAFARLLLHRVGGCLLPRGGKQLACKGRQPTDMVWAAVRMVHLAREWGVDMHMIKLDLRRAFDSVYRVKLAERVRAWCQQDFPAETRCMISMLAAADLVLALPWGCYDIHSNTGVKQGATESPLLFGRLIDEILSEIPFIPQNAVFQDVMSDGVCFMDDIVAWMTSVPALQQFLNALLPRLEAFGLFVQPLKCQLLSTKIVPGVHVILDGMTLHPVAAGNPL